MDMILISIELSHLPPIRETRLTKCILDNKLNLIVNHIMPELRAPHNMVREQYSLVRGFVVAYTSHPMAR